MKTYIADIIPKIQRFSKKLDDMTLLTDQHWVSLGDINQNKCVFIFRANNQLLISENGIVEKGSWEYLGNQSLLLETKDKSYLFKHGFFDENVIALKLDSTNSYAFFVNETKYYKELNNIEDIIRFLENKYLKNIPFSVGFGSRKEESISRENEHTGYSIIYETEDYRFSWGRYYIFEIRFLNGKLGRVYKEKSSERFFYSNNGSDKIYCNNLEDAIHKLAQHLEIKLE